MLCCVNCFNDKHTNLIEFIKQNGKAGRLCDYCGKKRTTVIDPGRLRPLFEPILTLYKPLETGENVLPDENWMDVGEPLATLLDQDFFVFSDDALDRSSELVEAIFNDNQSPFDTTGNGYIFAPDVLWCSREKSFIERPSAEQWEMFSYHLRYERRFIPDLKNDFFDDMMNPQTSLPPVLRRLEGVLRVGERYYRGRTEKHTLESMGAPPRELASAGRANPRGIPFLYLAKDPETVIAEVRPWKGQSISIAEFELVEDVRIIDLSEAPRLESPFGFSENLYMLKDGYRVLEKLSRQLSKPIDPKTVEIEYLPTQYITEIIRNQGYDGMVYKSAMRSGGHNLVLFSPDKAKAMNIEYVDIIDINYQSSKFSSLQSEKYDFPAT